MRFVPHSAADQETMLATAGFASLEALFADLPPAARLKQALKLPPALSEPELFAELRAASGRNRPPRWLGGGCYPRFVPSVVKQLVNRSEFYTAYTPYQPEVSQGILQAIFEYQTMICELTGMAAANASMYDGATALAEAALLACRATGRREVAVSAAVNPRYRQVLKTYAAGADLTVQELPFDPGSGQSLSPRSPAVGPACYILQQPNYFGVIEPANKLADASRAAGALFVVSADPVSLGLLKPPGEYGADIVVGEGQSLGNPAAFGGPGLGIFAVKKELVRQLPGRLVGQTVDHDGKRAYVLTLSTREQHIRREKATSNICSNEALAALAATIYLSVMGKQGLKKVAELSLQKTNYLKKLLGEKVVLSAPTFCELVVRTKKEIGLDLGPAYPALAGCRLLWVDELAKKSGLDQLAAVL